MAINNSSVYSAISCTVCASVPPSNLTSIYTIDCSYTETVNTAAQVCTGENAGITASGKAGCGFGLQTHRAISTHQIPAAQFNSKSLQAAAPRA